MLGPKMYCALLLACLLASALGARRQRRSSFFSMVGCVGRNSQALTSVGALCAARELWNAYQEMRAANCKNCDKYFHCIGNYQAMKNCGNSEEARRGAEAMSNCREEADRGADSGADQVANLYGRNGGDCALQYLTPVQCKYDPDGKTCGDVTTTSAPGQTPEPSYY